VRICVVVALPAAQEVIDVDLPEGATLADALRAAQVAARHPSLDLSCVGVWGRVRDPDSTLREGDRVECYRPVSADAKALRRKRAAQAGTSRAGRRKD
jgi:putative ubiquitin-RnfH superfamily antitoxin RatB of RatAB toxin-antitoxin module